MRTVFFGTPELAVKALRALAEITNLVGVVCQPDRPAGRGLKLREPAVKVAARELGLAAHQPVKVKTGSLDEWLLERNTDVAVVMAYGRILPPRVLAAPKRGCINLHASILPKYRGAAPINWAIVRGESETGVSLMQMDEGCDTGPVYAVRRLPIGPETTAGELGEQIADLAADVVREELPRAVSGKLVAEPQQEEAATLAPLIQPDHLAVDFAADAQKIVNLIRGMSPSPSARTTVRGKRLKLLAARVASGSDELVPGEVAVGPGRTLLVGAGRGVVQLLRGQIEGRRALDAVDLLNGRALVEGDRLGS